MSEETEVPIVCDDCGGNLTNAGGTIDDLFSMALGEDRPHYWHMEQSGCIASLNERLTAATKRAEAAEARRDVWELRARKVVQERRTLRVERDALRTVDDAMVGRFLRAYAECESERPQTFTHRMGVRAALDAALAVQPTPSTGPNT